MGWFKQLKKGNIGKAFKEATNSVKGVAVPVLAAAAGNALLPGLGSTLGKVFGTAGIGGAVTKGLTNAAGGIVSGGVNSLLGGGGGGGADVAFGGFAGDPNPTGAPGSVTIPGQGQKGLGMNDLIALYALTSKDKPNIRNAPTMAELANQAKNIPGWSNVEATTGQNDPMVQQLAAIDAQAAQAAATNFGADPNDVNASLDPLRADAKRLQDMTLGFGADRYKALRENFTSDLNDQFDTNQKKIAANMAARGMKGGVYNNAQNLNIADNQKQARIGLNNLLVENENAIRDDRWKQSAGLSDNAGAQSGILQDATKMNVQGRQTAEDVAARLIGLRGDAASKITSNAIDAAKVGQTGIATGIDAYKNELEKYKTDSEAWGNVFNGLAQAGSQFQAASPGTTIKPDGSVQPAASSGGSSGSFSDSLTKGLVDSFTNYFSNPNTTPGQKVVNGITGGTKLATGAADVYNNAGSYFQKGMDYLNNTVINPGTGRTAGTQWLIENLRKQYSKV